MLSDLTRWLLDPSGLTPHGFCLLWEPWLIWTHALSNVAIGTAYFSIPLVLARFARRRRDLVFRPVVWLFAAFIWFCGAGHWADLLTIWYPLYGIEGVIKAATALVSVATAAALWPLLPKALALPSHAQMQTANAALRASEARYREMFVRAPTPMHSLDGEGRIVAVSDRWVEFMGCTREDAEGRYFTDFLTPAGVTIFRQTWPRFALSGAVDDVQTQMVKRSGEIAEVLISARIFQSESGTFAHTMGVITDITGRVRAEERLRHAHKMEAVGQLTGGIAHDFNNVLQAVTGNLEMIRRRVRDDRPDVARLADNALDAAGKATDLTTQLLAFARRQKLDPRAFDPMEAVESMRTLLARTAGERIALRIDLPEREGAVAACLADRNQLEAALLNLVINARDAIGKAPGTITVSLRMEQVRNAEGWPPDGEYVRVSVRDDGPGMPDEVRRRAFEPFFTTKAPGKGTGLGLSQIHGFAHQSGGTATIDSAPGAGTEVAILLPTAEEPAPGRPETPTGATEPEAGFGETVLLVEDEPFVRAALAETLRELRYRVIEAADGDRALTMLDGGAEVDAILSDVTMPGSLDGLDLTATVRRRLPEMAVVLMTGRVTALEGRLLPPGVTLLHKPISRVAIATALRRAFSGTRNPMGESGPPISA